MAERTKEEHLGQYASAPFPVLSHWNLSNLELLAEMRDYLKLTTLLVSQSNVLLGRIFGAVSS